MAGLGESCSHVAAVVFMVEYSVKKLSGLACTDDINKWLPPTVQSVAMNRVHEMDWRSSDSRLTALIEDSPASSDTEELGSIVQFIKCPSQTATASFLGEVKQACPRASVCSTMDLYCEAFIPPPMDSTLPEVMTSLWDPSCVDMEYQELVAHCGVIFDNLVVTADQIRSAEEITRKQSKCEQWYQLRRGRITASAMKLVCRGNVAKPAISTVNKICQKSKELKTEHVLRGKKMESVARKRYELRQGDQHVDLSVLECGLFICQDYPFIAASPDGIVSCSCCGKGGLEIKCPLVENLSKCLDSNGHLRKDHEYYYQVQTQMFVCGLKYTDLFLYVDKTTHVLDRVLPDTLIFEEIIVKTSRYFKLVILPELVAKHFTLNESRSGTQAMGTTLQNTVVCYCRGPRTERMVICAGKSCTFSEYHLSCVNMTAKPRKKWLCDMCSGRLLEREE